MGSDLRSAAALFSPARLTQARHLSGITRTELARRAELSAAVVGQYESGATRPRPQTVGQLAMALGVPVAFLTVSGAEPTPPSVATSFFRSLRSTSQREREQAAAAAGLVAQLAWAIERRVELPPYVPATSIELVPSDPPELAEKAAAEVRSQWGLGDGPIPHLIRTIERAGIIVARLPFENARVDAFSWVGGGRPLIVLGNDKGFYERSRFDSAHELGHIVLHSADPEPANQALERQANRFASALLMPAPPIVDEWPSGRLQWPALIRLKSKFGVSLAALLYRAKDLELLTPEAHQNAMRYLTRTWGRKAEPGPRYSEPEQPGLLEAALRLLEDNNVTFDLLAEEARLLSADDLRMRIGLATGSSVGAI